jgi:thiamine biosynthesis lipoprotein
MFFSSRAAGPKPDASANDNEVHLQCQPPARETQPMNRPPAASAPTFQRVTVGLGTFLSIQAQGVSDPAAQTRALDRACEAFQTVERVMHPTTPGSDLVRIAEATADTLLSVHPWTFDVLALSLRLWRSSAGHFDPCLPTSPASVGDLQLVEPTSVRIPLRPALLDLGGIAKGFAIDRAVDALIEKGCSTGLVNAGGDMRAFGRQAYEIELRTARSSRPLQLAAGALAVSAPKTERSPSGHRGFYSRITGTELSGHAVGVLAPSAAVADALTKCALTCPADVLRRVLEEFSASLLTLD